MAVLLLGGSEFAMAGAFQLSPGGSDGGFLTIDPGASSFTTSGGVGNLFENFSVNALNSGVPTQIGQNYSGDLVFNVTSFTGASGTGINLAPGWQLFAVVSVAGEGNWANFNSSLQSGTFSSTSATVGMQLYAVNTSQLFTGDGGTTHSGSDSQGLAVFGDPGSANVTVPSTNTSLSVTNMATVGELHVGDRATTEFSGNLVEPTGAVANSSGSPVCIDNNTTKGQLNSSPSFTGSQANCILVASGSGTGALKPSSVSITNSAHGDTMLFSLDALLTDATDVTGSTGLLAGDPTTFNLQINSGPSGTGTTPDAITDNTTPIIYTSNPSDVANFDLPVPEPASLTLLGTALAGFGWFSRRRRHSA